MLPCTLSGSFPMFSIMSISPQSGQSTVPMLLPSIQKAGHIPCPRGILIRASKRPYFCSNNPRVLRLTRDAVGSLVGFLVGGDDKVAILHVGVRCSIRVGLEFV